MSGGEATQAPAPAPAPTSEPAPSPAPTPTPTPSPLRPKSGVGVGVWTGLARFWDTVSAVGGAGGATTDPTPASPVMALFNPFRAAAPPPAPAPADADSDAPTEPPPADALPAFHAHASLPAAVLLEAHRDAALPQLLGDIAAVDALCGLRRGDGWAGGDFGGGSGYQQGGNLEHTARSLVHLAAGVHTQLRLLRGLPAWEGCEQPERSEGGEGDEAGASVVVVEGEGSGDRGHNERADLAAGAVHPPPGAAGEAIPEEPAASQVAGATTEPPSTRAAQPSLPPAVEPATEPVTA
ncbi:hypothetical protein Q8F55_001123 [Vanrija albida]|uniref:Uncharacterized protein n=1 Tax=Vanrija albida TaxID=181172 RepID=A0ABR3QF56_9TREE